MSSTLAQDSDAVKIKTTFLRPRDGNWWTRRKREVFFDVGVSDRFLAIWRLQSGYKYK